MVRPGFFEEKPGRTMPCQDALMRSGIRTYWSVALRQRLRIIFRSTWLSPARIMYRYTPLES